MTSKNIIVTCLDKGDDISAGGNGEEDDNTISTSSSTCNSANKRKRNDASQNSIGKNLKRKVANILLNRKENRKDTVMSSKSDKMLTQLGLMYKNKLLPIEKKYYFPTRNQFAPVLPITAPIHDSEFNARPMVLLLGQYSTGKTSFIRYILGGKDLPGMHIGPEPTTDRFIALVHGQDEEQSKESDSAKITGDKNLGVKNLSSNGKVVKGNTLTVTPELPFGSLSQFGSGFLTYFEGCVSSSPMLKDLTFIDTPGVLSGEKQHLQRSYDFPQVTKWFADRAGLILILFDAHKLDISDEFKHVIESIRPHNEEKIRCVLNKADAVTKEELVHVYGSLMWSLGKIFPSPENVRVFTGSFWEQPFANMDFQKMFEDDERLLLEELSINLPKSYVEQRVNEMVKRIRLVKVHICIMSHLQKTLGTRSWFGKRNKLSENQMIQHLQQIFETIKINYNVSDGDMPNVKKMAECLESVEDYSTFQPVDEKILKKLDDMILYEIPHMMKGVLGITDTPILQFQSQKKNLSSKNEKSFQLIRRLLFDKDTDLKREKNKAGNDSDGDEKVQEIQKSSLKSQSGKRKGILSTNISIALLFFLLICGMVLAYKFLPVNQRGFDLMIDQFYEHLQHVVQRFQLIYSGQDNDIIP